jgi:hypothetical protein
VFTKQNLKDDRRAKQELQTLSLPEVGQLAAIYISNI